MRTDHLRPPPPGTVYRSWSFSLHRTTFRSSSSYPAASISSPPSPMLTPSAIRSLQQKPICYIVAQTNIAILQHPCAFRTLPILHPVKVAMVRLFRATRFPRQPPFPLLPVPLGASPDNNRSRGLRRFLIRDMSPLLYDLPFDIALWATVSFSSAADQRWGGIMLRVIPADYLVRTPPPTPLRQTKTVASVVACVCAR